MTIASNVEDVQRRINDECQKWTRTSSDVTLIAVSKKQPEHKLQSALECGHRAFGENRVQEAYAHWGNKKENYPDLMLHLIGPLQTNKVKDAVQLFDVIHTVDREKLARRLGKAIAEQERDIPCFVQVNIGEEPQKSGIMPHDLTDFLEFCKTECDLNIIGLMCIPPIEEPAALYFALMRDMARRHGLHNLSMGMSSDYEKAIALGATHIRVGTSVFGAREDH